PLLRPPPPPRPPARPPCEAGPGGSRPRQSLPSREASPDGVWLTYLLPPSLFAAAVNASARPPTWSIRSPTVYAGQGVGLPSSSSPTRVTRSASRWAAGPRSTMSMMMETMPAPRSHRPAGSSDRRGPGRPRYEAERVPGRVGVAPPAALPAGQPAGAQRQHLRLGGIDVVDHDVEMHLLRPAGVGPPRRLEAGRQLEPDARGPVVCR